MLAIPQIIDFDQARALVPHGRPILCGEFLGSRRAAGLDTQPLAILTPVHFRVVQVQHGQRLGACTRGADPLQLDIQDRIGTVGVDDDGDIQILPRHRPQGLHRVGGAAVAVRADHLAAGRRQRGADGERQPLADRTAGQRQVRVRTRRPSMISKGMPEVAASSA